MSTEQNTYGRDRSSGRLIWTIVQLLGAVILLGTVIGIAFLVYSNGTDRLANISAGSLSAQDGLLSAGAVTDDTTSAT